MINQIKDLCKEKNIPLQLHAPDTVNHLVSMALAMGYTPIGEEVEIDGKKQLVPYGTEGTILIQLRQDLNKYNNGVYFYKENEGAYVLEVLIPNTADKSDLITKTAATMENFINTMETADLDVYDTIRVFSHVIANTTVKQLAKALFPNSEYKQFHFVDIYYPRFLANMARYYLGDETIREETVNTEPFVVKLMIDGDETLGLVGSPETTKKEENAEENKEETN